MATSTGAKAPTAAQSVSESPWSDDNWVNPQNIYGAGEASVTAATFDAGDQTEVLKAYTFDFSSVPSTATITGVTCIINARYATAPASIDLCQLLNTSRAKVGTNLAATPVALTTSAADYTFGGSSNLWGNSLTVAWVQDTDFGVAIGCLAGGSGNNNVDVYIDSVTLNVAYTDNKNLSAGYGEITLTGYAPTAAAPRNVRPGYGELSLTGYSPLASIGIKIKPGYGELLFEGFAPTVATTKNVKITPGYGELILTGLEPIILTPRDIKPNYGELLLEGFAPTLTISNNKFINPDYGELTLDAYAPSVKAPRNILPDTGSLTLEGYHPTVLTPRNVTPDYGELSLEGYNPAVKTPKDVKPDFGQLTFEGYEPVIYVSNNKFINPDFGELGLNGFEPIIKISDNKEVTPNTNNLGLDGFEPLIILSDNRIIITNFGEVFLNGFAPIITIEGGGVEPEIPYYDSIGTGAIVTRSSEDLLKEILEDDAELLSFVEIFMRCR